MEIALIEKDANAISEMRIWDSILARLKDVPTTLLIHGYCIDRKLYNYCI